ncbi:tumor necrosis factor receptor superfamily member 1B isoform 2-T2 [Fundulus diaphanus]
MKDILPLLVLLTVQTNKVHPLPYHPDSYGICRNHTTEYFVESTNLCCKRCPPGHRLKQECDGASDSQCVPCGPGQYMENWNFYQNCFSCTKCKEKKGLEYAQECTPTTDAKCVCKSGMFCEMGFNDPYCTHCASFSVCKRGYRVSVKGTGNSDVKCEKCPTDPCEPRTTTVMTTVPVMTTVTVSSNFTTPRAPEESTHTVGAYSIMGTKPSKRGQPTSEIVPVIAGVAGSLLFFIIVVVLLLILYKRKRARDPGNLPPKLDANGNRETAEKNGHSNSGESRMISLTLTSPEQEFLLEKGDVASDQSLSSSDTETSTKADGSWPLQTTLGLDNLSCVLSEPMALQSITDPHAALPSVNTQSSSQPTSPLILSPVTNNPHVNVNITLHIGNGSCGTPPFHPTDFNQVEDKLPFGKEEESVSSPQQEAGKLSFMSVQESPSYYV